MIFGGFHRRSGVVALIAVVIVTIATSSPAAAQGFTEVDKLVASNPGNDDEFGKTAAVSGDTLVVGAPGAGNQAGGNGLVYVFERDANGVWVEDVQLSPSNGNSLDDFGFSVDIDGDTIAVGNPNGDGEIFVFERDGGGVWNETAILTAFDGDSDELGFSVTVSGDTIAAGAPESDFSGAAAPSTLGGITPGSRAGAVYVYEKDGLGAWVEVAKLVDPDWAGLADLGAEDQLGRSVSMSADRIVAGAPHLNSSDFAPGSTLIFSQDGFGDWVFDDRLASPPTLEGFGSSVGISGDRIAVGSLGPINDQAFVFEFESPNWVATELLPSGADFRFGVAVDILGDEAVVGSQDDDLGIAYSFERDANGDWNETGVLQASDGMDNDDFGEALALGPGELFVGARNDDAAPFMDAGAVYVFSGGPPAVSLSIAGSCPGSMTLTVETALPDQDVVLFLGRNPGTFVITGGGCVGTELDLSPAKIFRTVTTDANGTASVTSTLQDRFCGKYLQGIDRMCAKSNLLQIPPSQP